MDTIENRRFHQLILHLNQTLQNIVIHNNYNQFRHACFICKNYLKPWNIRETICKNCYDGNKFNKWIFDYDWFGEQEPFIYKQEEVS